MTRKVFRASNAEKRGLSLAREIKRFKKNIWSMSPKESTVREKSGP